MSGKSPERLSNREIIDSWGSQSNFMHSHGLKTYNPEDWETANDLRVAYKQNDNADQESDSENDLVGNDVVSNAADESDSQSETNGSVSNTEVCLLF